MRKRCCTWRRARGITALCTRPGSHSKARANSLVPLEAAGISRVGQAPCLHNQEVKSFPQLLTRWRALFENIRKCRSSESKRRNTSLLRSGQSIAPLAWGPQTGTAEAMLITRQSKRVVCTVGAGNITGSWPSVSITNGRCFSLLLKQVGPGTQPKPGGIIGSAAVTDGFAGPARAVSSCAPQTRSGHGVPQIVWSKPCFQVMWIDRSNLAHDP